MKEGEVERQGHEMSQKSQVEKSVAGFLLR